MQMPRSAPKSDTQAKSAERPIPRWIEPRKFAVKAAALLGYVSADTLERLDAAVETLGPVNADLKFDLTQDHRPTLTGSLSTKVTQLCQRCLEPVHLNIKASLSLMMVLDEDQAKQVATGFEPWLVSDEEMDLHAILEEELLLNLPLIARHDSECVAHTMFGTEPTSEDIEANKRSPFDVLKQLKIENQQTDK